MNECTLRANSRGALALLAQVFALARVVFGLIQVDLIKINLCLIHHCPISTLMTLTTPR